LEGPTHVTKPLITHLRHAAIAAPDLDRQLAFYRDLWGLTLVASDSGVHFLAAEGSPEQYIIRLRKDDQKRMDLVAFGADSAADVDALAADLAIKGVQLVNEPAKLDTPGGGYGFRFFDGDGRVVEVSSGSPSRPGRSNCGTGSSYGTSRTRRPLCVTTSAASTASGPPASTSRRTRSPGRVCSALRAAPGCARRA